MTDSADADRRAAVRTVWLAAIVLGALVLGSLVVFVVRQTSSGDGGEVRGVGGSDQGTLAGSGQVAIGPPLAADIASYVDVRRSVLRELTDDGHDRLAVVSLVSYRSDADASVVIVETAGHTGIDVVARLVVVPGDEAAVVENDLAQWAAKRRSVLQQQRDEIASLLPTVGGDAEYKAFYEREVARLDRAISVIGSEPDVVFGFIVRGSVSALQALAERAEVRLVDVGPVAPLRIEDGYRGLLPDDTTAVSNPELRP